MPLPGSTKRLHSFLKGIEIMSNQNPANQLMDIAMRIRDMREILGYSMQRMAELTDVSEENYKLYETGTVDLPFTFIHKCAGIFGVDIAELMGGVSPELTGYTVTRRGKGKPIVRRAGFEYNLLA